MNYEKQTKQITLENYIDLDEMTLELTIATLQDKLKEYKQKGYSNIRFGVHHFYDEDDLSITADRLETDEELQYRIQKVEARNNKIREDKLKEYNKLKEELGL